MKSNNIKNKIISFSIATTFAITTISNSIYAYSKNETVYTKLDIKGNGYSSVVSVNLKNYEKNNTIKDMSNLLNIQNVSSDKTFEKDGNTIIWNAQGEDIYYKGESKEELPIDTKIKYELDGKEIDPKDIAGKSGKLKITIEYINKDKHEEIVNGQNTTMYTPFVVFGGTIFKNEKVRNVEISSGKVIDDGSKTIVVGIALPGMQESLNIDKDSLEIPGKIEITMEVTNYEQNNIVSFVTPKVIEENDLEKLNKLDAVYENLEVLKSSSMQLENGANTLKEGTQTFSQKTKEFSEAMNTAANGINSASTNYIQIDEGINQLYSGSPALSEGSLQIYGGIQSTRKGLVLISEGIQSILEKIVSPLKAGITNIIQGIDTIYNKANQGTQPGVTKVQELEQVNSGNAQAITATQSIIDSLNTQLKFETDEAKISAINAQLQALQGVLTALKTDTYVISQTKSSITELQAGLNELKNGVLTLQGGVNALDENTTTLKQSVDGMYGQTEALEDGAKTLSDSTGVIQNGLTLLSEGSKEMKSGLNALNNGAAQLNTASSSISDASNTINEGANTLATGIHTFNTEGINKVYTYINSNVKDITDRVEVLQRLSNNYNSFTQEENIDLQNKNEIKFIMITDAIKIQK